jgi:hypothetical protein
MDFLREFEQQDARRKTQDARRKTRDTRRNHTKSWEPKAAKDQQSPVKKTNIAKFGLCFKLHASNTPVPPCTLSAHHLDRIEVVLHSNHQSSYHPKFLPQRLPGLLLFGCSMAARSCRVWFCSRTTALGCLRSISINSMAPFLHVK